MKHAAQLDALRLGRQVLVSEWKQANNVQRAALHRGLRVSIARCTSGYRLTPKGLVQMRRSATFILAAIILMLAPILAFAQAANTATITFIAPTQRADGSAIAGTISYKVYQGIKGQTKAAAGTITATSTTISTGLQAGTEYCWEVTATETIAGAAGPESARSNEACKAFAPGSAPRVVTITVT